MKTLSQANVIIDVPFQQSEKVLTFILDLKKWEQWSPWTCIDPQVKIDYSQPNGEQHHSMQWQGPVNGEGKITIVNIRDDGIDCKLEFIKPFKSQARTHFTLYPHNQGQAIKLEWTMQGSLPFFIFFIKKMMEAAVTKDFIRGLKRIKYLVETGKVPAQLEFQDIPQERPGFEFCGLDSQKVPMSELPSTMEKEFQDIQNRLKSLGARDKGNKNTGSIEITGGYCFYSKIDLVKDLFNYTLGHSYNGVRTEEIKATGLLVKSIPPHRAIKVTLTGSWHFLDDAWSGIMMHQRALKFKPLKSIPPYEHYLKMGDNPEKFVTEIYFPIK